MYWKREGTIGVAEAMLHYTKLGFTVSVPINDSQPYDLVIDDGKTLKRVSCKTVRRLNARGRHAVDIRTTGTGFKTQPFDPTTCDIMFISAANGRLYEIPTTLFENKAEIVLSEKWDKYLIRGELAERLKAPGCKPGL
jgi:hypothetical protein